MKENLSTLIAVGGVILIPIGVIAYAIATGQTLDYETIKMSIAALAGFAGGTAAVKLAQ